MNTFCPLCHDSLCPGCTVEPCDAEVLQQRRMDCARVFYDLETVAHDLAVKADRIGVDPVFILTLDANREAWIAHLDALSDPEGMNWSAGLRS